MLQRDTKWLQQYILILFTALMFTSLSKELKF